MFATSYNYLQNNDLRTKRKFRALTFDSFGQAKEWQNNLKALIKSCFEERNWTAMGERQDLTLDEVELIVKNAL